MRWKEEGRGGASKDGGGEGLRRRERRRGETRDRREGVREESFVGFECE